MRSSIGCTLVDINDLHSDPRVNSNADGGRDGFGQCYTPDFAFPLPEFV